MKSLLRILFLISFLLIQSDLLLAQWVQVGAPSDEITALAVKSNGDVYAGTYQHGLLRSTDNGASWYNRLGSVQNVYEVYCIAFSPNGNVYVGSHGAGLFLSTNDGLSWGAFGTDYVSNLPVDDVYGVGVTSSYATDTIVALDGTGLVGDGWQSTDGGSNWSETLTHSAGVYCLATGGSHRVFVGGGDWFDYSTNDGSTWTWVGSSTGLSKQAYCLAASSIGVLYAGTQGKGVFISVDGGKNWSAINNGITDQYVNCLAIAHDTCIFAGTHTHGMFFSSNSGGKWQKYDTSLTDTNIISLAVDSVGNLYAGTNAHGIWVLHLSDVGLPVEMASYRAVVATNSVSLTWETKSEVQNAGFNILRKESTQTDYSMIASYTSVASLRGLGTSTTGQKYTFVDSKVKPGVTYDYEIEEVSSQGTEKVYGPMRVEINAVPTKYSLYQNYPNPFNPTTTISYQLAADSHVTLRVYDVLGREVATLVDEMKSAGEYTVKFDGSKFASGVYFYRFSAGGVSQVKGMLLLK